MNGRDVQFQIAMTRARPLRAATVQAGDGSLAGESGMKRVIVRSERFRRVQGIIKASAGTRSATPIFESRVRPKDPQLRVHDGHAVRQGSENALRLKQVGGPLALVRLGCVCVNRIKALGAKQIDRPRQAIDSDGIEVDLKIGGLNRRLLARMPRRFEHQDSATFRHSLCPFA